MTAIPPTIFNVEVLVAQPPRIDVIRQHKARLDNRADRRQDDCDLKKGRFQRHVATFLSTAAASARAGNDRALPNAYPRSPNRANQPAFSGTNAGEGGRTPTPFGTGS